MGYEYLQALLGNRSTRGLFGPKEPWGMSWREAKLFKIPNFDDIAFSVITNVEGIIIDAR